MLPGAQALAGADICYCSWGVSKAAVLKGSDCSAVELEECGGGHVGCTADCAAVLETWVLQLSWRDEGWLKWEYSVRGSAVQGHKQWWELLAISACCTCRSRQAEQSSLELTLLEHSECAALTNKGQEMLVLAAWHWVGGKGTDIATWLVHLQTCQNHGTD